MSKIIDIQAIEVLDYRGNPTVYSEILLQNGVRSFAYIPSDTSKIKNEACEIRDVNNKFYGKGVKKSVKSINKKICKYLLGLDSNDQYKIDKLMIEIDGNNKSNLCANAILAVSIAIAKATAKNNGIELYEYISELYGQYGKYCMPVPMINIINCGANYNNNINIQELMIQPIKVKKFSEALRMGSEIFYNLKNILYKKGLSTSVGYEGVFTHNIIYNADLLEIIHNTVNQAGYNLGEEIVISIDCASSEFYKNGKYICDGNIFDTISFINYLSKLIKKYNIFSIEDAINELDWIGCKILNNKIGKKIQIIGDDLFVKNTNILKKGIEKGIANSILIKFNKIGTLTETINAIKIAKKLNYTVIISHLSCETEDTTIADLAVGTCSGQIKTGSILRTDSIAKYNRLLLIENHLNSNKIPYGWGFV